MVVELINPSKKTFSPLLHCVVNIPAKKLFFKYVGTHRDLSSYSVRSHLLFCNSYFINNSDQPLSKSWTFTVSYTNFFNSHLIPLYWEYPCSFSSIFIHYVPKAPSTPDIWKYNFNCVLHSFALICHNAVK